jgi:predicted nucleic acid-binding protein
MKFEEAFNGVKRVFLDTAPVIYYVEQNAYFLSIANRIFEELIEKETVIAVASPVTVAECLVAPIRDDWAQQKQEFIGFLIENSRILLEIIDHKTGQQAAKFRANYNLTLTDALQVAVALQANCDALLTNDVIFKRVTDIPIIILSELELSDTTSL